MTQPVSIGQTIKQALAFNMRRWREGEPMNPDGIPVAVIRLLDTLAVARIPHVLVGGIAMLNYVSGRNTEDIDLIIAAGDLTRIDGLTVTFQDRDFARGTFAGLQVDFLLTGNKLFKRVMDKHSHRQQFAERELQTATVEGLVLLKLYALPSLYRQGDFTRVGLYENDIATLLFAYAVDLPALMKTLAGHLSATDMEELRRIVGEIEARIRRFRERPARYDAGD